MQRIGLKCIAPLLVMCCDLFLTSRSSSRWFTVRPDSAHYLLCCRSTSQHDTPKYGLIYHASLIGQAAPKNKGKISRVLAAKCALAIRVDALADETDTTIGLESRTKVWTEAAHLHRRSWCRSLVSQLSPAFFSCRVNVGQKRRWPA